MPLNITVKRSLTVMRQEDCDGSDCCFYSGDKTNDDLIKIRRLLEANNVDLSNFTEDFPLTCFTQKARARLLNVDIIVANYHLLLWHDYLSRLTDGKVQLLPPFTALICDEAHKIADIARGFYGITMRRKGLNNVTSDVRFQSALREFFGHLQDLTKGKTVWLQDPIDPKYTDPLLNRLQVIVKEAHKVREAGKKNARFYRRTFKALKRLNRLVTDEFDDEHVRFIDAELNIGSKAIDAGDHLQSLWQVPTVVLTSATLATDYSFEYLIEETGFPEDITEELTVDSPFEYQKNSLLFIDDTLPDPSKERDDWELEVRDRVLEIAIRNGGRALCLFTSRRMLRQVERVASRKKLPFNVYAQGSDTSGNQILFEKFKEDKTSILLGLASFREGADAPGDTCTCVILDKIPFPMPDDPVMQALKRRHSDAFDRHFMPRAMISMKQGIGRLIRRITDRGTVAILDPRLITKRYGEDLLSSVPEGMPITTDIEVLWERMEFM